VFAGDVGEWGPAFDTAGLGRVESDLWDGDDGTGLTSAEVLADAL